MMARARSHNDPQRMEKPKREQLRRLIRDVPTGASEDHPAFIAVLEAWSECAVPWDARPTVRAYKTHSGEFIVDDVNVVLREISEHAAG